MYFLSLQNKKHRKRSPKNSVVQSSKLVTKHDGDIEQVAQLSQRDRATHELLRFAKL